MAKNTKSRTSSRKANSRVNAPQKNPHAPSALQTAGITKLTHPESAETTLTAHSGPLPSPEDFARYNEILPNAAERIMAMAEKQQKSRAERQTQALTNDRLRIIGAVLFDILLLAVVAVALIYNNTIIAVLGLGGVIAFVLRQIRELLTPRK